MILRGSEVSPKPVKRVFRQRHRHGTQEANRSAQTQSRPSPNLQEVDQGIVGNVSLFKWHNLKCQNRPWSRSGLSWSCWLKSSDRDWWQRLKVMALLRCSDTDKASAIKHLATCQQKVSIILPYLCNFGPNSTQVEAQPGCKWGCYPTPMFKISMECKVVPITVFIVATRLSVIQSLILKYGASRESQAS